MVDYFDVMYYAFVEIETDWDRESNARVKAVQKARREARKARAAAA
jgi:hypothetical protein